MNEATERKTKGMTGVAVLFVLLFLLMAVFYMVTLRDLRKAHAEIERLKTSQVKLLEDYKAALEENHKLLTQSLSERYFDSLIMLRNRIEQGYVPTEEEREKALDRAAFLVENMNVLELPPVEADLRLKFIDVMKEKLGEGRGDPAARSEGKDVKP